MSIYKKLFQNKTAFLGISFITICLLISILGTIILPDPTPNSNRQILETSKLAPFSSVTFLKVRKKYDKNVSFSIYSGKEDEFQFIPIQPNSIDIKQDTVFYKNFSHKKEFILLPLIFDIPNNSTEFTKNCQQKFNKPYHFENNKIEINTKDSINKKALKLFDYQSLKRDIENNIEIKRFWFGTDLFGRDILSRILLGTRYSLSIGFISMFLSILLGYWIGVFAGLNPGFIDKLILGLMGIIWAVPSLLLSVSLSFLFGKGFFAVILAITFSLWVDVARIIRLETLKLKEQGFIEATHSMGFNQLRITFLHILPNMYGQIIILATSNFATAILLEAGLSFLGLGLQTPTPSWGNMVFEGYTYIVLSSGQWLAILPGLAIVLLVLSLNWLGMGLRDALDSKIKL